MMAEFSRSPITLFFLDILLFEFVCLLTGRYLVII